MKNRIGSISRGLALLLAPGCFAGSIFVNNFSFETLPAGGLPFAICGPGCSFSTDNIPGWSVSNPAGSGQLQPGTPGNTTVFNSVPDGSTTAFSNSGTIIQVVGPLVQLGVTYTLTVDIGISKLATGGGTPGQAFIGIVGTSLHAATGVLPGAGDWATFTATYTGLAADVGKQIEIRLLSTGVQGNWDNVRMSDDTVPEPAALSLVGLALGGLAVWKRRRT